MLLMLVFYAHVSIYPFIKFLALRNGGRYNEFITISL